jgi:hypothetical protein
MTVRRSRGVGLLAALLALALAVAAAPAWGASGDAQAKPQKLDAARSGPIRTGNGIVQAVRAHAIVVRMLDGRTIVVPVVPRTVVIVNGARSGLAGVQPGFVVSFTARAGGPALEVRASGGAPAAPKAGTVQSVSGSAVVVTAPGGGTQTIAVGGRTKVILNGSPVSIADIVAGDRLVKVGGDASGQRPARVLRFRR